MMGEYTLYLHQNKINGKVYVGITKQNPNKRWQKGYGYLKTYFYKAIEKFGWDNFEHLIIEDNLEKNEAFLKEKELIKKYRSDDKRYGYNIAEGGAVIYGARDRVGAKNHKSTAVWQINAKTGERIKKYESQNIAAKTLGIKRKGITKCCRGICKTYKGFIWEYADKHFDKPKTYERGKYPHKKKKVLLIDVDGKRYEFNGTEAAAAFVGTRQNNVIRYCSGDRSDKTGRRWFYV